MPENIQSQLPTIEDIEATLSDIKETKEIWKSWDWYEFFSCQHEFVHQAGRLFLKFLKLRIKNDNDNK